MANCLNTVIPISIKRAECQTSRTIIDKLILWWSANDPPLQSTNTKRWENYTTGLSALNNHLTHRLRSPLALQKQERYLPGKQQ